MTTNNPNETPLTVAEPPERIWVSREYALNPDNHRQLLIDDVEYTRHQPPAVPLADARERVREIVMSHISEVRYGSELTEDWATIEPRRSIKVDELIDAIATAFVTTGRSLDVRQTWRDAIQIVDTAPVAHFIGKQYIDPVAVVQRMNAAMEEVPLTTNAATGAQTCVKCGHNSVNSKGECRQCIDWQKHVCEFPATTTADESCPARMTWTQDPCVLPNGHEGKHQNKVEKEISDRDITPAATPSISAAIACVEKLRDEWQEESLDRRGVLAYRAENELRAETADEILKRLRTLQPSTPSELVDNCSEVEK